MFQHSDLGVIVPYIHAVASGIIDNLLTLSKQEITRDIDASIAIESTRLLEALCVRAPEEASMLNSCTVVSFNNVYISSNPS